MGLEVIAQLYKLQAAVGEALTKEQQLFVSSEYGNLDTYLHTDAGKQGLQAFVDGWQRSRAVPAPLVPVATPTSIVEVAPKLPVLPPGMSFKIKYP